MCECEDIRVIAQEERKRTARKEHTCLECEKTIPVGAEYLDIRGVYENTSDTYALTTKMCLGCDEDWQKLTEIQYDHRGETCLCFGTLEEAIGEACNDGLLEDDDPLVIKWFGSPEPDGPEPLAIAPELPGQLHLFPDS